MSFDGIKVVVSGTFTVTRSSIEQMLRDAGADVTGRVSSRTHLLVCGSSAGSKLAKATSLGVPVIDEAQMHRVLAGTSLARVLRGRKKTSAKKTSAKKTSAKKTSAKKTSAKKTSAKKTSAKKTSSKKSDIEWTKALRKRLHGFVMPHPADPKDAAPTLDAAWATLRDAPRPKVKARSAGKREVKAVLGSLQSSTPPDSLDRNEELARTMILWHADTGIDRWPAWSIPRALVALWFEVEGPDFVVDLLSCSAPFSAHGDDVVSLGPNRRRTLSVLFGGKEASVYGPLSTDTQWEPLWWALRSRLAAQDDADFAQSVQQCRRFLRKTPTTKNPSGRTWRTRAAIVYALARDSRLAAEQIDRYLGVVGVDVFHVGMWIASAPDLKRANRLNHNGSPGRYCIDLIRSFGHDAGPLIQRSFDAQRKVQALRYLKAEKDALALLARP